MMLSKNGKFAHVITLVCALLLCAGFAGAQAAKAPPASSTPMKDVVHTWNDTGRKLIAMAEDFPEAKYDWKPTPEVRSFAEQLLHAAGSAYFFEAFAKGQKPGEEDPKRSDFKSKAEIVAYVKKGFADGAKFIQEPGDAGLSKNVSLFGRNVTLLGLWAEATEHSGEHYGQLVVYYRMNKMVPPESRPRK
jgi:hypothetical protein